MTPISIELIDWICIVLKFNSSIMHSDSMIHVGEDYCSWICILVCPEPRLARTLLF